MVIRYSRALLVAASASALALAAGSVPARAVGPAGPRSGWHLEAAITVSGRSVVLYSVAAISRADAWTIGNAITALDVSTPIVEHWTGLRWQPAAIPARVAKVFGATQDPMVVGARSATDVWAFDELGHWMRLNGRRWTAGNLPLSRSGAQSPVIRDDLVLAHDNVWAFGSGTVLPYAANFGGRHWHVTPMPGTTGITDASAVSSRDIWAINEQDVLHWDGHRWRTFAIGVKLNPSFVLLGSVNAHSDHDVWIGGAVTNGRLGESEAAAHWNGHSWHVMRLPAAPVSESFELTSMIPDGGGGMWAFAVSNALGGWRMWHYGAGAWHAVPAPVSGQTYFSGLASNLALAPGSRLAWAVGAQGAFPGQKGIILVS